jgi:phospholipase/carboxylesterase
VKDDLESGILLLLEMFATRQCGAGAVKGCRRHLSLYGTSSNKWETFHKQVIVRRPTEHKRTVIWLHGMGQTTQGLLPLLEMSCPPWCRLVIPVAPLISITARQGRDFPAWYDVHSENPELDFEDNMDFHGLEDAKHLLLRLLNEESQKIDSKRIVLAGFQQGGAVALHAG